MSKGEATMWFMKYQWEQNNAPLGEKKIIKTEGIYISWNGW